MRQTLVLAVALALLTGYDQQAAPPAVVLITLDGARTEEIFGGLDLAVLKSTLSDKQTVETQPVYRRFWAPTPEARREKLMPFFWGTLMREHGSIAGNRAQKASCASPTGIGSRIPAIRRFWSARRMTT